MSGRAPGRSGSPAARTATWPGRFLTPLVTAMAAGLAVAGCGTTATRTAASRTATAEPFDHSRLQRDVDAITAAGVTGVQTRVTRDGHDMVATSGVADVRTRRPVTPDDRFRIGSSTKTFTAAVVLQLAGEGRLSLSDTVEHRLPGVVRGNGNDGRKITIRQLLQHTSGIHNPSFGEVSQAAYYRRRFEVVPPGTLVAEAMKHRPDFAPGTSWSYSNPGYILLAMIIERATGRPWYEEVDRRIVRPLGLRHTSVPGLSPDLPTPHSEGYTRFPGGRPIDTTRNRMAYTAGAAGAIISTTADLDRFYRALLGGRLLRPAELAEMKRTVPVSAEFQKSFPGARYGLGLFAIPLPCGGRYWGHGGDIPGFMTRDGFTEDGRRGAVVSMSTEFADSKDSTQRQERAAGVLIDHALCDAHRGTP